MTAPFPAAAALVQLLAGLLPIATVLALACAVFAGGWALALLVAVTGKRRATEGLLLALSVPVLAFVIAAGGGAGSPLLLLAAAPAVEARWVARSREATLAGVAAGALAALLAIIVGPLLMPATSLAYGLAAWLVPGAYLATVWLRRRELQEETPGAGSAIGSQPVLRQLEAAVMRIGPDGEIVETSEHCARCFGILPEMLIGKPLLDRVHVGDRVSYMCALSDVRAGGGPKKLALRLRLPTGEPGLPADGYRGFEMELIGGDADGGDVFAIARDTAELDRLRGELLAARDNVASSEIAKSRFLAAVSHELRTPLNTIIGFSDMMLQEIGGPIGAARRREYVGLIRESGHHLLSVVNSILDVSKIEAGAYHVHPEPFMLAEAVELCRSMMAPQAEAASVTLTTQVTAEVGEVVCDRRAVQQILLNLMSNAVKFTPENGRVAVEAWRNGSRLVLTVSDTGIGIDEADLCRLGQPFVQVQNDLTRQFEGTGLGLALVKGLVKLHRGEMTLESEPGQGTTVRVVLPADGPACETLDAPGAPATTTTAGERDEKIRRSA